MARTKSNGTSTAHATNAKKSTANSSSGNQKSGSQNKKEEDDGIMSSIKDTISRITVSKKKSLQSIFEEELKDVYNAEKQLIEALPKMAKATANQELKSAFMDHLQQTKKHAERIEMVFKNVKMEKDEKTCEAMKGLVEEGEKIMSEFEKGPVRDAAMIIGAQKVEHYEIAAYGSLTELADVLGFHKAADILERTLQEEEETDKLLTEIAKDVNDDACDLAESESEQEGEEEKEKK